MRRQSGFTLVELLIVVLIIGILATVAIPAFNGQRAKSKNAVAKSSIRNATTAAYSAYTTDPTFNTFDLASEESSLNEVGMPAASTWTSITPGASADPRTVYSIAATWSPTNGRSLTLCVVSRGTEVYCSITGNLDTRDGYAVRQGKSSANLSAAFTAAVNNTGW